MTEISIQFLGRTHKVPEPILINGFKFTHNKGNSYRCCSCGKNVVVKVDSNQLIVGLKTEIKHDTLIHRKTDMERVQKLISKKLIREEILENPLKSNKLIKETSRYDNISLKEISRIRSNIKKEFEIPADLNDLVNYKNNSIVLAYNEGDMILLGEPSGLIVLSQSTTILMDGTFKSVSCNGQLYIVHGVINNKCVCCLYCRMSERSQYAYKLLFNTIQTIGERMNLNIFKRAVVVKTDFEISVINIFKNYYPEVFFNGCYFHYAYNIMKHVRKNGLFVLYKKNYDFKKFIKRMRTLCMLPLKYISTNTVDTLYLLVEEAVDGLSENNGYVKLKNYIERTWLGLENGYCKFPPVMWNVFNSEIRTNNLCEASHRIINEDIGTNKLDMIGTFQLIKNNLERDKERVMSNKINVDTKKVRQSINATIELLKNYFENKLMNYITYLDLVSMVVQLKNFKSLTNFKNNYLSLEKLKEYESNIIDDFEKDFVNIYPLGARNDEIVTDDGNNNQTLNTIREITEEEKNLGTKINELVQTNKLNDFKVIYECDYVIKTAKEIVQQKIHGDKQNESIVIEEDNEESAIGDIITFNKQNEQKVDKQISTCDDRIISHYENIITTKDSEYENMCKHYEQLISVIQKERTFDKKKYEDELKDKYELMNNKIKDFDELKVLYEETRNEFYSFITEFNNIGTKKEHLKELEAINTSKIPTKEKNKIEAIKEKIMNEITIQEERLKESLSQKITESRKDNN